MFISAVCFIFLIKWRNTSNDTHPDDVTILFLDYDVIIFDDVNP